VLHRATSRFWKAFQSLPPEIQGLARKNFALLKDNSDHPSLQFKKVGNLCSARVGKAYRALAVEEDEGFVWVWIGHHKDYDQLIKK